MKAYKLLCDGVMLCAVFRQGDIGTSWYAVLSGSLDVKVSETANHQVNQVRLIHLTTALFGVPPLSKVMFSL